MMLIAINKVYYSTSDIKDYIMRQSKYNKYQDEILFGVYGPVELTLLGVVPTGEYIDYCYIKDIVSQDEKLRDDIVAHVSAITIQDIIQYQRCKK